MTLYVHVHCRYFVIKEGMRKECVGGYGNSMREGTRLAFVSGDSSLLHIFNIFSINFCACNVVPDDTWERDTQHDHTHCHAHSETYLVTQIV